MGLQDAARASYTNGMFTIKDRKGHSYTLEDVSRDPDWERVKVLEEHRNEKGLLVSITGHKHKTFLQRKQELEKELNQ